MKQGIPDIFKNQDTIYHYCSTNVAIEHILFDKRLRFSPRNSSFDPIENSWTTITNGIGYYTEEQREEIENQTYNDATVLKNGLIGKLDTAKQLCFCKNEAEENFKGQVNLPDEYFGFLKPRMWDQYGNKFEGVCLSFSREKLEKMNIGISNDMDYVSYKHLSFNHISIDHNALYAKGIDEYGKLCDNNLNRKLFRKHCDYSGENEFRMYSFSEQEYDYIDISDAINGIIVSKQNLSKFSEDQLIRYAKTLNIEFLYLNWTSTGVRKTTLETSEKINRMIEESFDQFISPH